MLSTNSPPACTGQGGKAHQMHCNAWAWRHEDGGVLLVQVAIAFATPMMSQSVAFVKEKIKEELPSAVLGDSGGGVG